MWSFTRERESLPSLLKVDMPNSNTSIKLDTYINTLEESLSIPTGRCDLANATHARKMHKKIFVVVQWEVLDND